MRILVADDERDTVLTVRDFRPDAVLLDIAMPDRNGFELAQEIRSGPRGRLPVLIAISGRFTHGSDRILAELVGFDHLVAKPYDVGALLKLLAD